MVEFQERKMLRQQEILVTKTTHLLHKHQVDQHVLKLQRILHLHQTIMADQIMAAVTLAEAVVADQLEPEEVNFNIET